MMGAPSSPPPFGGGFFASVRMRMEVAHVHQKGLALAILGAFLVAGCGRAASSASTTKPAVPSVVRTARHGVVVTSPNGAWMATEFPHRDDEVLWWPVGQPGQSVREFGLGRLRGQPGGNYVPVFVPATLAPSGYLVCAASMAGAVDCFPVESRTALAKSAGALGLSVVLTSSPPSQPVLTSAGLLAYHYGAAGREEAITEDPATGAAKRVVATPQATAPGSGVLPPVTPARK